MKKDESVRKIFTVLFVCATILAGILLIWVSVMIRMDMNSPEVIIQNVGMKSFVVTWKSGDADKDYVRIISPGGQNKIYEAGLYSDRMQAVISNLQAETVYNYKIMRKRQNKPVSTIAGGSVKTAASESEIL